jgi:hypothetical protein
MNKDAVGFDSEKLPPDQLEESSTSGEQTEVRESRRRFSRLGIGVAPIVISLVSKPVLGAQCLSNMLSGNLSDPNRGNCRLGTSPGGWGNPGGNINGVSAATAWGRTGYTYGVYKDSCGHRNKARCYEGGSTVASLPPGLMTSSPSTKTLREVLLDEGSHNRDRHVLAAWLNAKFSENSGGTFTYILTTAQVIGLANGSIPLPQPYLDLNSFLDSTWN